MKHLLYLLIALNFISCGSAPSKKGKSETTDEDIEKEFAGIKNEDFKTQKPLPFKRSEDFYTGEESLYDSLATESISRLPEDQLENIEEKEDPIASLSSLCYRKDFAKADKLFDSMYEKYKLFPSYWNSVGTCHYLKGEKRKAFLYYNKSRDLSKDYSPAYNNLGVIYLEEGKDQKALLAFQKAYDLGSFSLTPIFNLGQLYLKYGFVEKAQPLFTALFQKNATDTDVLHALSTCYLLEKDAAKALELLESMDGKILKGKVQVRLNYILALAQTGNKKKAQSLYSDIETAPKGSLGNYYQKVGKYLGVNK
jgi:tetratricopeptide (TPR) repeat protein